MSEQLTKERVKILQNLIYLAFETYGIDAKTSIGYGLGKVMLKKRRDNQIDKTKIFQNILTINNPLLFLYYAYARMSNKVEE